MHYIIAWFNCSNNVHSNASYPLLAEG